MNISRKFFLFITLLSFSVIFASTNWLNDRHEKINAIQPDLSVSTYQVPVSSDFLRKAAYGYAYKWYNGRNPHYFDFSEMGGDCANFVSQCLIAGGLSLHKGTDGGGYGVYPDDDRPSVSSYGTIPYCDYLHTHLCNYHDTSVEYVTETNAEVPSKITVGDVVIFGDKDGDKYKHAMIVVTDSGSTVGLAGHSSDRWNMDFFTELSYFSCATFYHINVGSTNNYHFRVDAGTLNVRVGSGKNSRSTPTYYQDIGDIHQGEEYIAFGYELDEDDRVWWHFWFDDRAAWCAAWYTESITGNQPFEVDVSQYLNVRDGPGTENAIFGQVYYGMRFVSDLDSNGWYRFWYSGRQKYSSATYLNDLEEIDEEDPYTSKTVFGYLPHWVDYNQNFTPLTHVAWFNLELNSDGSIGTKNGWPVSSLVNNVHDAGRKIVVTATMFSSSSIDTLLASPTNRMNAINNLLEQVQIGNADGVSIDLEFPTGPAADLVDFMSELYSEFKSVNTDYHISIATPTVDWQGNFDYSELSKYSDALFIMGYNYYYSGSSKAGPCSPLRGGTYNLEWTVNDYLEWDADPEKMILGLPFYGWDYPVNSETKQSSTRGAGKAISYNGYKSLIAEYSPTINYDSTFETSWFNYYESGDGWHQVWCDDVTSLSAKIDYILDRDLAGLGIWAYGYQGDHIELEQLIIDKFKDPDPDPEPLPPVFESISLQTGTISNQNEFNIEWSAEGNMGIKAYSISWDNGQSWEILGLSTSLDVNLTDGYYELYLRVNDTIDNTAEEFLDFWIDTESPVVNLILSDENITESDSINISWVAEDATVGIASIAVKINNDTQIYIGTDGDYQIQLLNLTAGTYLVEISVVDFAGNVKTETATFNVVAEEPTDTTTTAPSSTTTDTVPPIDGVQISIILGILGFVIIISVLIQKLAS